MMSDINLKLRHLRQTRNLSQAELAQKLGISRQAIIALEQGSSLPSLPVIMALLQVLDIPFNELFGEMWNPFRAATADTRQSTGTQLAHFRHSDTTYQIPVQLTEDVAHFDLVAELAGVREEDLTIDIGTQHILIMAIKNPTTSDQAQAHVHDIQFGPLMRILSLPSPVDTAQARADFSRGLLRLILPKQVPATKRRITFEPKSPKEDYGS